MSRLERLRHLITEFALDGILITNPENRRYLSGFTGSAGALVIGAEDAYLVTDFRYWEQVNQEVVKAGSGFLLSKQGADFWKSIGELLQQLGWGKIGFEAASLNYRDYQFLAGTIAPPSQWIPLADTVETLRQVKDTQEIETIAKAAEITDKAWAETLKLIKPGVRERDLASEYDYQLRRNGADGSAFKTIVASGVRSALPHGIASDKELAPGDLVIVDGGALFRGYHGDMTRTVVVGPATPKQKEVYRIVLSAQQAALDYLKAGIPGNVGDRAARQIIIENGYGEMFGHGLGHSVGLNIHENPRLSPSEEKIIPANAVITVEPGIYIPDWGGARIEDLVVVTEDGIINLTHSPKESLLEV